MNFFDRLDPQGYATRIEAQQKSIQYQQWLDQQQARAKLLGLNDPKTGITWDTPPPLTAQQAQQGQPAPLMGQPQPQMGGLMGAPPPQQQSAPQFTPPIQANAQDQNQLWSRAFPEQAAANMAMAPTLSQIPANEQALARLDPKAYTEAKVKSMIPPDQMRLIGGLQARIDALGGADSAAAKPYVDMLKKETYIPEMDPLKRGEMQASITEKGAQTDLARTRAKLLDSTGLSDDTLERGYQQILGGQKFQDVFPNVGRGVQGPAQLTQIQEYMTKRLKQDNLSPTQFAAANVNLKAQTAAAAMAAKRGTGIDIGADELHTFGDQVLEAGDKLGDGNFVPWNKLSNMADSQISNPELAGLKVAIQGVKSAYATVLTRGGANNVDAQHKADDLLSAAQGMPALRAVIAQMKREAVGAKAATTNVQNDISARITGGQMNPAANPGVTPVIPPGTTLKWTPDKGVH